MHDIKGPYSLAATYLPNLSPKTQYRSFSSHLDVRHLKYDCSNEKMLQEQSAYRIVMTQYQNKQTNGK